MKPSRYPGLALLAALVGLGVSGVGPAWAKPAKEGVAKIAASAPDAKLVWPADLGTGIRRAQAERTPILVSVGAEYCPWCRKLQKEMAQPAVQQELARWTLVALDLKRSADEATQLGVGPIPALRVLTPGGEWVSGHEGFIEAADLLLWLRKHYETAAAAVDAALVSTGPPDAATVARLVIQLGHRSPTIREAAVRRLLPHPGSARGAVLKAFGEGGLSTRLAALELLAAWHAPVEGLDPWRPETLSVDRLAALHKWADSWTIAAPEAAGQDTEGLAAAERDIERLLQATPTEADAAVERLARWRAALLPAVIARLQRATTDVERQRLLTLRYRLVAGDALVLAWPGGLGRLASLDVKLRRQAAEELARLATAADQALLLELFANPDPLVRELALRGLQHVGGEDAVAALVRLLDDPEPNVRAAVLKQLAESPTAAMVPHVVRYVVKEQDPDLVVHAIRVLKSGKSKAVRECLISLLTHSQWQVRAEAAESLAKLVEDHSMSFGEDEKADQWKADVYAALLHLLDDPEGFVVSRAVQGLEHADMEVAIEPLVEAAAKHPDLASKIVQTLAGSSRMAGKAVPHLKAFLKHPTPAVRAAAVAGIVEVQTEACEEAVLGGLSDPAEPVRLAAAKGVLHILNGYREPAAEAIFEQKALPGGMAFGASPSTSGVAGVVQGVLHGLASLWTGTRAAPPKDEKGEKDRKAGKDGPSSAAADSTPEDTRGEEYDRWLTKFYTGRGRPEWTKKVVEPLEKLLGSSSEGERLQAARTLTALGQGSRTLPVLLEIVGRRPELVGQAGDVLPWMVWDQRQGAFEQFRGLAKEDQAVASLIEDWTKVPDRRAADRLWAMLAEPKLSPPIAGAIVQALQAAYTAERYLHRSAMERIPRSAIRDLTEAAKQRVGKGSGLARMAALTILANVAPDEAGELAAGMADDRSLEAPLRHAAFQIRLAMQSPNERRKAALAALGDQDPDRRKLALACLARGPSHYVHGAFSLNNVEFSDPFSSDSERSASPTAGLKPDVLRPFLADPDPRVAADAGYLLALLGERDGLEPVLRYWRREDERGSETEKLVYRAIAALDDSSQLPLLKKIYEGLRPYAVRDFYWTIRPMTGPQMIEFRKQIRDEVGMSNLR